ncbi:L-fucose mutarotase [Paenibacillus uliginis N3/975]|uniref:L-fucose mutarotase n=1 Tax=Paenibacillus uliginis N3/975 TaxID=1313296 RepID=A0A1X7HAH9_9BACL|nr:L-fucose mutarotase [Paenibacillus uliginis]SMF82801.1 L-fucose mutarotase [Paenibacillus uliginis N3/975]
MLKGISNLISPELIKVLMEMGHGDEIVFGDGNFPAASHAQRLIRCDGHGIPELLRAILPLFPLDIYTESPVALMAVTPGDTVETLIWDEYRSIVREHHSEEIELEEVERFFFYDRAKKAYAIVSTGEKALYANVILKKGVVVE